MTTEQIRQTVLHFLHQIAPEADIDNLKPAVRLRDQFEFDSVDFLAFATALQNEFNIPIPEKDYPKLATLDSCVEYLSAAQGT